MDVNTNTILIIEDDLGLIELLSEKIEFYGYKTVCVQSAGGAFDWLKGNVPFMMILDYSLPDMNGKEFIAEFKTKGQPVPPFIVSTGQGDERIAVEMMKLGARDYVIKDTHFLEMITLVIGKVDRAVVNETKLRLAEKALVESNQFSKQIIQSVQEGIVVYDRNMKFVLWNPFVEILFGIPASEVLGKYLSDFAPLLKDPNIAENIKKALHGEITPEVDFPFNIPFSGKSGWISGKTAPFFNTAGDIIGAITTVRDITERKQTEETIQNERLLLRTLIDNIPDLIYSKDLACRKTLVNLAGIRNLGATSEIEVLGRDDFYFYPKELAEMFYSDDQSVLQTGMPILNREEYILDKNGNKQWRLTSKLPLRDSNGQIIGLVGIGHDITERKLAEEEVKQKNEELLKANSEKDKFFSIIAHDLRSPFNGFLGLTQIMAEELPVLTKAELQNIAIGMRNSANNLYRLLDNLLEWARMQQGLILFNPKMLELAPIVEENITMISEMAKRKEIEATYDIPCNLVVFADSNILQTVIRNLVSNAVKFTLKGGKISISAKATGDDSVEIAVRDTGIGMNPKMIENLFRLDVQTNRKGTDGEPSTGLGLLLCKEFVEKHRGKFWVESEEGKGSVFYFTIPNKSMPGEKNAVPAECAENQTNQEVPRPKILIVEDDDGSARLLAITIKSLSKEILSVRTGIEAVETCRSNPDIDLVLMDIQMPGIDGYEATRQIRKFNQTVVIIAQTAYALSGDEGKSIEAGCNDYIAKPIKKKDLIELLQKYFKNYN
jgi:PAS domain S-box-containing protein